MINTLGDYVSKGLDTQAVISELRHDREHRLIQLRGNHELLMQEARLSEDTYHRWTRSGGDATLRSYDRTENAPTIPEIP